MSPVHAYTTARIAIGAADEALHAAATPSATSAVAPAAVHNRTLSHSWSRRGASAGRRATARARCS